MPRSALPSGCGDRLRRPRRPADSRCAHRRRARQSTVGSQTRHHPVHAAGRKPEPGETDAAALARELHEELGLAVDPEELVLVGEYVADAANEEHTVLDARVFDAPVILSPVAGTIEVAQEIEELVWVDPAEPGEVELAPLSSEILLPLLAARNLPVK